MTTNHKRFSLILLLSCFSLPLLVQAGSPTDQIRQTTDKILAIVQDPAFKGEEHASERQKQMRMPIDERFDWAAMARSALGRNWRKLSEEQRATFTVLFSDLIEKTYMSRIESYSGEKIIYKGDKVDGLYGVVEVVIVTSRGNDVPVSYRVLQKGDDWLVYDIIIEGVSMVNNYRSQIGSILDRSSYDELIAKLKLKINANESEPAENKSPATKE